MAHTTIIGIAGGSGSGKTSVTSKILKNLRRLQCSFNRAGLLL